MPCFWLLICNRSQTSNVNRDLAPRLAPCTYPKCLRHLRYAVFFPWMAITTAVLLAMRPLQPHLTEDLIRHALVLPSVARHSLELDSVQRE